MREGVAPRNRGGLFLLSAILLCGWGSWAYCAISLSPYLPGEVVREPSFGSWSLFFGALGVALFATFTLVAYHLSFRLFASKSYRGNLARSCQHGLLWSVLLIGAGLMRSAQVLTLPTAIVLAGVLIAGEIVILVRK